MSGILLFFFLPPSSKPPSYLVCWRVLWTDTARCVLIEITDKPISWTLLFQFLFQPPSLPLSLFWLFCPESQFFFERKNQQIVAKARNGIHSLDLLFLSPSTQLARKKEKGNHDKKFVGALLKPGRHKEWMFYEWLEDFASALQANIWHGHKNAQPLHGLFIFK